VVESKTNQVSEVLPSRSWGEIHTAIQTSLPVHHSETSHPLSLGVVRHMATHQVTGKDLRAAVGLAAWLANSLNNFWAVDRTAHRAGIHHRATTTTATAVVAVTTTATITTITTAAVAVAVAVAEGLAASGTWQVAS
jgi:hypothetical protein